MAKLTDGKLAEFSPQRRNANRHTQRGLAALESSMRKRGYVAPMTAAADGEILDGSARAETSANVFGDDVLVIHHTGDRPIICVRDDIPSADTPEAREISIAANRIAQINLDFDAEVIYADLQAGVDLKGLWKQDELDELLGELLPKLDADAEPQTDKADELRVKWGVESGQMWQLGEHRLICGDCTDAAVVARVMQGERAQAVVTSPPYPGADMWDDMGAVAEVERVGLDALRVSVGILDDGCAILWNIANTPIGTQAGVVHTTTTTTKHASETLGLLCYGEIIWSKPVQHLTPLSFMMRPVVPNLIHEYIMIFYKGKRKQRENISGLSSDDKALRVHSVWELPPQSATEANHKAPFPLELARRCIALWSLEGDAIYEPFAGSGTTGIACMNTGRRARMVEIDPKYCAVILERFSDVGITPTLMESLCP